MLAPLIAAPQELEHRLGDPADPGRVFCYARSAELDEREEFPVDVCRELDFLGVPAHYVPVRFGGRLDRHDVAVQLLRVLARRDLTVAIAHGKTFLGAVCIWLAGSAQQAGRLGADVVDGAVVSWALTERDHGSDLLAGEVTARPVPGGYRLDGEKWLINNATRGHLLCVLGRTGDQAGPRCLSLFLVDKRTLDPAGYTLLPAEPLHGIRGADISGIRFSGAFVPAAGLVGVPGEGLEIVLKSLQLTRILCGALSLGAADSGLALARTHARTHHRFGRPIAALPQTRRVLAEAAADLLLAEAFGLVAARSIHALPGELGTVSAAAKYLLPTIVQGMLTRLGDVLGAHSLLLGGASADGRFQKVVRDHRLVGIFDGSTVVNLHALVTHFPFLARGIDPGRCDDAGLRAATDLEQGLPEFVPDRLALVPRHGSSLLHGLPHAARQVADAAERDEVPDMLATRATGLAGTAGRLLTCLAAHRPTPRDQPTVAFDLAEQLARCLAGAAAVHLWAANRRRLADGPASPLWRRGLWLEAALHRVAVGSRPWPTAAAGPGGDEVFDRLAVALDELEAADLALSVLPGPQPWARGRSR